MIGYKDNFRKIAEAWKKKPITFLNAMNKGLEQGMRQYESWVIKKQLSGRKNENYGLNKQSGIAANSLNVTTSGSKHDTVVKLTVDKSAWYLKTHQHYNFTGFIKPKNKKYLTIPVIPGAVGRSAADFELVFIKPPGKDPVLVGKGKDAERGVVFALKKQVYIPKRLYFFEEFETIGRKLIRKRVWKKLQKELQKTQKN